LFVALDAVPRKSFQLDAGSETEAVAQPLNLADTIFYGAVKGVRLAARYDGILRLYEEPFTRHHSCTGAHHITVMLQLSETGTW